MKERW